MKKYFVIIINLLSIVSLLIISLSSYSLDLEKDSIPVKLNKLQSNPTWQDFMRQMESKYLNYELYRITGSSADQNIILSGAVDPRGYFVGKHDELFCSPIADPKNCKPKIVREYADIRPSVLLEQNIFSNKDQLLSAIEVINNITNPFPSRIPLQMLELKDDIRRNSPHNQAAFAETLVQEARLGVAKNSFNSMMLDRLSLSALEGGSVASDKNFSKLSLMEQEAKSRFEDSNWNTKIENAKQDDLLKEMVKMEAFKIWMEYHKYKQNERIEALLATMIAEQSSLNQLLIEQKYLNAQKN
ncbi:MAG: hypothetical protein ABSA84_08010 [Gammaproteobacteria bacterium]|jgi:hypothetical protein